MKGYLLRRLFSLRDDKIVCHYFAWTQLELGRLLIKLIYKGGDVLRTT